MRAKSPSRRRLRAATAIATTGRWSATLGAGYSPTLQGARPLAKPKQSGPPAFPNALRLDLRARKQRLSGAEPPPRPGAECPRLIPQERGQSMKLPGRHLQGVTTPRAGEWRAGHAHFWERVLSRRQLVGSGMAAGAVLGAGLLAPKLALAKGTADPRPIAGGLQA